jgi:hypothetical protein
MLSSCEPEVSSWETVAKGFARGETCITGDLRGIVRGDLDEEKPVLQLLAI